MKNILCLFLFVATNAFASATVLNNSKIDELTGLKGTLNEKEQVYKVSQPRNDVKVSVDGWSMPPFMGLTSWVGFTAGKKADVSIMGDLVLFQDEVNPVMSVALDNGLKVTALHNHFFYDEPKVYFMHVGGEGKLEPLAAAVGKLFAEVKKIRSAESTPAKKFSGSDIPDKSAIAAKPLEDVFGQSGQSQNGMFKVVIGRHAKMSCGCNIGKEMGVNTWAAFAGTDDNAVVDGDFAMLEPELQKVLITLRARGINIVAIHHHMTEEKPKYLFLHYWGRGKAVELAQAVKAALDTQSRK